MFARILKTEQGLRLMGKNLTRKKKRNVAALWSTNFCFKIEATNEVAFISTIISSYARLVKSEDERTSGKCRTPKAEVGDKHVMGKKY